MQIRIEWQKPVQLTFNNRIIVNADALPIEIESGAGVYFFARWYGERKDPFYIGQSTDICSRLKQHLKSQVIADVLRAIIVPNIDLKKELSIFIMDISEVEGLKKQGRAWIFCLDIVERQMIRQAVQLKFRILNQRMTTIDTHEIVFDGSPESLSIFSRRSEIEAY